MGVWWSSMWFSDLVDRYCTGYESERNAAYKFLSVHYGGSSSPLSDPVNTVRQIYKVNKDKSMKISFQNNIQIETIQMIR